MTADDYAKQRPDLLINWQRAHDPAWIAANPGSAAVAAYVASFPDLPGYLQADYGIPFARTAADAQPVIVTGHRAADSTHRFVANDKFGNPVYQLIDEDGHLIQWTEFHNTMQDTANLLGAPAGVYVPQAQTYTVADIPKAPPAPADGGNAVVVVTKTSPTTGLLIAGAVILGLLALGKT